MLTKTPQETWSQFLEFISERCSATEFENWFSPIRVLEAEGEEIMSRSAQHLCAGIPPRQLQKGSLLFPSY